MKCQRKETQQIDGKTKENNKEQIIHWSKYNKKTWLQSHQSSTDRKFNMHSRNPLVIQTARQKLLDAKRPTLECYQDARGKVIEPKTNTVKWAVVLECIKNSSILQWRMRTMLKLVKGLFRSHKKSQEPFTSWYALFLKFRASFQFQVSLTDLAYILE